MSFRLKNVLSLGNTVYFITGRATLTLSAWQRREVLGGKGWKKESADEWTTTVFVEQPLASPGCANYGGKHKLNSQMSKCTVCLGVLLSLQALPCHKPHKLIKRDAAIPILKDPRLVGTNCQIASDWPGLFPQWALAALPQWVSTQKSS